MDTIASRNLGTSPGRFTPSATVDRFGNEVDTIETPAESPGGSTIYPFDAILTPDPMNPGDFIASIQPGTLNGLLPSNFTTTYPIVPATTYYLVLSATVSSGQITGCSLSMPTSPPASLPVNMGQPPLSFDYLLGVVIGGAWFRTIGPGSLSAQAAEVFRTDKSSPAPGTLPYDIWYTWLLLEA